MTDFDEAVYTADQLWLRAQFDASDDPCEGEDATTRMVRGIGASIRLMLAETGESPTAIQAIAEATCGLCRNGTHGPTDFGIAPIRPKPKRKVADLNAILDRPRFNRAEIDRA